MIKNEIIEAYYAKGLIFDECSKLCKDTYLCEDLAQEVTMIMMNKDESFIQGLNERGELLFYVYKVAKNQYCSKTSPFYHKYKRFDKVTDDGKEI